MAVKTVGDTNIELSSLTENGEITVQIGKDFSNFSPNLQQIKENAKFTTRGKEVSMINEQTGSTVGIRQHGQINLTASKWAAMKLNPNGLVTTYSLEEQAVANRCAIQADDIVVNEHKFHPYLAQLATIRKIAMPQNTDILIGNLCTYGSVLTKSWEPNLKRYVMIRRSVRLPMFSSSLNVPEIHGGLGITDPLKIDEDLLAKSDKGFQVNKVYLDENSLIGKDGVDREGINRNANLEVSVDASGYVNTPSTGGTTTSVVSDQVQPVNTTQPVTTTVSAPDDIVQLIANTNTAKKTSQILLWVAKSTTSCPGTFYMFIKNGTTWQCSIQVDGKHGQRGINKARQQGGYQSPAGCWQIREAGGHKDNPGTKLKYHKHNRGDLYFSDTSGGYGTHGHGENFDEFGTCYNYTVDVGFRAGQGTNPNASGGCILFHCPSGVNGTAGCFAIPEEQMIQVLRTIDTNAYFMAVCNTSEISLY